MEQDKILDIWDLIDESKRSLEEFRFYNEKLYLSTRKKLNKKIAKVRKSYSF